MNKQKIAVIVDSGCDLPEHYMARDDVFILPFRILYKDNEYISKVNITTQEILEYLPIEIPTTSLSSGQDILDAFEKAKQKGYTSAIVVNISSQLSGTNNLVNLIAKDYEGLTLFVLDTKNIGIGSGFLAMDALDCIDKGMAYSDICQRLQSQVAESKAFISLSTLEYLQKGGRIGKVASILGSAFHVKPIISCDPDGIYYTVKKSRGRKKSLTQLVELAAEYAKSGKGPYRLGYCLAGNPVEGEEVRAKLIEALPESETFLDIQIDPSLAIHTGPDLIGIGVYRLPKD